MDPGLDWRLDEDPDRIEAESDIRTIFLGSPSHLPSDLCARHAAGELCRSRLR